MELTDEQIEILQIIHDSENHAIHRNEIPRLKIDFPNLDDDLQQFIESDFVEYELRENKYYLAYKGFKKLENKVKLERPKTDVEQYREIVESLGGAKKFQRTILLGVLIITIIGTIILCLNPEIGDSNQRNQFNIEESVLNDIKSQLQEKLDSVQDLKNMERIDLSKENK